MGLLKSIFGNDDKKKSSSKTTSKKTAKPEAKKAISSKKIKTKAASAKKEAKPIAKKEEKINFKDPFAKNMVTVKAGMFNQESMYPYQTNHGDKRRKMETAYSFHTRRVIISHDYMICKYLVTQSDWKKVMGEGFNPSYFRDDDDLPVESVTWEDVQEFIKKLNKLTGKKYRLPTEAEWEWAARGASKDKDQGMYAGCDDDKDLVKYAWMEDNSDGKTHPVGKKKSNELDLYDMNGNVWEWCEDTFMRDLGTDSVTDPLLSETGKYHTVRGGCYYSYNYMELIQKKFQPDIFGCSNSSRDGKSTASNKIGFRLAMSIN